MNKTDPNSFLEYFLLESQVPTTAGKILPEAHCPGLGGLVACSHTNMCHPMHFGHYKVKKEKKNLEFSN